MIKNYKIILISFLFFVLLIITYLSTFGIKTSVFNNSIKKTVKKSTNLDIILDQVFFKLYLNDLSTRIETSNAVIKLGDNKLNLDIIVSEISIINLIKKKQIYLISMLVVAIIILKILLALSNNLITIFKL